jgi:hypothetical protein
MGTIAKRESLGRAELESLVTFALDEARKLGVDQAEVVASQDTGLSATARLGEVESLEYTNDRGIGITVFKDQCKGSASTSDVSPDAIRETVAKACSFAKVTARDEFAGLADAELMCKDVKDLDLDHPWKVDANSAQAHQQFRRSVCVDESWHARIWKHAWFCGQLLTNESQYHLCAPGGNRRCDAARLSLYNRAQC